AEQRLLSAREREIGEFPSPTLVPCRAQPRHGFHCYSVVRRASKPLSDRAFACTRLLNFRPRNRNRARPAEHEHEDSTLNSPPVRTPNSAFRPGIPAGSLAASLPLFRNNPAKLHHGAERLREPAGEDARARKEIIVKSRRASV